jgi:hypothetical protein
MGVLFLMAVNCSFRYPLSRAGKQADAVGIHSRNGRPFGFGLFLERRTVRTALEQWQRQLTSPCGRYRAS